MLEKQLAGESGWKIFASLCNGASGYVLKSAPPEDFLRAIRKVAAGGTFFTPSVARRVLTFFLAAKNRPRFYSAYGKGKGNIEMAGGWIKL
jgi:DNA-binding NarL/FixJ family response regulator